MLRSITSMALSFASTAGLCRQSARCNALILARCASTAALATINWLRGIRLPLAVLRSGSAGTHRILRRP
jgi:hypothetical protein